ncbi:hypothetical protein [Bauldia sp.]|uniref:hypothetical protein n=1 Tax=Bauldia sp. TaxID=2575872 RepID=UPI003BAA5A90
MTTIKRYTTKIRKGENGVTDLDVLLKNFDDDNNAVLDEDELNGSAGGNGGKLYVWQDANLDGIAQKEEVQRLTNVVKEIDATEVDYLDNDALVDTDGDGNRDAAEPAVRFRDGSMIYGTAKVKLQNGGETTAYDMAFAYDDHGIKPRSDGTIKFETGTPARRREQQRQRTRSRGQRHLAAQSRSFRSSSSTRALTRSSSGTNSR